MPTTGGVQFDYYVFAERFFDCVDSPPNDAPTLTGHFPPTVAPTSTGHFQVQEAHDCTAHTSTASDLSTGIRRPKPGAAHNCERQLRRFGCGTLIMEIFAGSMILTALALSAGWPCSEPLDIAHDGLDLTSPQARKTVDGMIAADDPFCIVFPFPCGPWNSLTEFNAARLPEFRKRMYETREEHIPMLRWMAEKA